MQATRIVYILIAIILLLPWLVYNFMALYNLIKKKKRPSLGRLLLLIGVSMLIIFGVYSHYRLTISYQAPLVAERAGQLFSQRVEGQLDLPTYAEKMVKQGLGAADIATVAGEDLEHAGFQRKFYELSISERTFPMDDGSVIIYFNHKDELVSLYSFVRMYKTDDRWIVTEQNVLTKEQFEEIDPKLNMRFYPAKP